MIGEKLSLPGVHVTRALLARHDLKLTSDGGSGGAVKIDRRVKEHNMVKLCDIFLKCAVTVNAEIILTVYISIITTVIYT